DVLSALTLAAQPRELVKGRALVRGIAFHRLHEIGNKIGAALQLRLHAAPGFGDNVLPPHQTVEGGECPKTYDNNDRKNRESVHGHETMPFEAWPSMGVSRARASCNGVSVSAPCAR